MERKFPRPLADGVSDLTDNPSIHKPRFTNLDSQSLIHDSLIESIYRLRAREVAPGAQTAQEVLLARPSWRHFGPQGRPRANIPSTFWRSDALRKSTNFWTLSKSAPGGLTIGLWPPLGRLGVDFIYFWNPFMGSLLVIF